MVGAILWVILLLSASYYCWWHDDPKRLARQEGKCCNDSFCEGDCGGWGA